MSFCDITIASSYNIPDGSGIYIEQVRESNSTQKFECKRVERNDQFSTCVVAPTAFDFCGIPIGISSETPLVRQFLRFVENSEKVICLCIAQIIFSDDESVSILENILVKHAATIQYLEILSIHSSQFDFSNVVKALCSLKSVRRVLWRGREFVGVRMEQTSLTISRAARCEKHIESFIRRIYNTPQLQFCEIFHDKKIERIDTQVRFERAAMLRDELSLRKRFRAFVFPLIRSGLNDLELVRVFSHVILQELREFSSLALYDETLFIESLFSGPTKVWMQKYLAWLRTFKLAKTAYFCRTCQFPLRHVEKPLFCECKRACFCSDACRIKKQTICSEKSSMFRPQCCTEQVDFGFQYCSDCLLQDEYHFCTIAKNGVKVVCNKCYFGACPRGCGTTFSNDDWVHYGKEHHVLHKCHKQSCRKTFWFTCCIKNNVNSGKKTALLCNICESNYVAPDRAQSNYVAPDRAPDRTKNK